MDDRHHRYAEQDLANASEDLRKRQRYRPEAKSLGTVVNRWIARRGLAAERSIAELERSWRELVGEPLAARTRVGALRRNALEIVVDGSVVMQQLQFKRHQLLTDIQRALPHYGIEKLMFRSGHFD
jgi:predicted nucleic acid-binding Zn ribbon protein